ncbi:hypothetical protein DPMN_130406 [Dreissena polymorpha]|uniref:Prohibitin n=1 Tax=Dreissena polymorpha TaxID=45954 RepID=A0A9D4H2W6_DREPO|nr:hypothetical protein DPMN_130406 [Dreissena polymorpha]
MFLSLLPCCPQVAQQDAQRATFYVDKAKQEKQQNIVKAQGEAQAAKLISFQRDILGLIICWLKLCTV